MCYLLRFKKGCDDTMMPILYLGRYSEMDGLQLTCELIKRKKKGKHLNCSVWGVLLSIAVKMCRFCWTPFHSSSLRNGHCGFKKLNCPLACADWCDWWCSVVPMETRWKQELLLTVCGGSWFVWLPFRKVACAQHGSAWVLCKQHAVKNCLNVTNAYSKRNNCSLSRHSNFINK